MKCGSVQYMGISNGAGSPLFKSGRGVRNREKEVLNVET